MELQSSALLIDENYRFQPKATSGKFQRAEDEMKRKTTKTEGGGQMRIEAERERTESAWRMGWLDE